MSNPKIGAQNVTKDSTSKITLFCLAYRKVSDCCIEFVEQRAWKNDTKQSKWQVKVECKVCTANILAKLTVWILTVWTVEHLELLELSSWSWALVAENRLLSGCLLSDARKQCTLCAWSCLLSSSLSVGNRISRVSFRWFDRRDRCTRMNFIDKANRLLYPSECSPTDREKMLRPKISRCVWRLRFALRYWDGYSSMKSLQLSSASAEMNRLIFIQRTLLKKSSSQTTSVSSTCLNCSL